MVFHPLGPLNKEKVVLPRFKKNGHQNRRYFHHGIVDMQYPVFRKGISEALNHNLNTNTAYRLRQIIGIKIQK
jgi:hypothetical protein